MTLLQVITCIASTSKNWNNFQIYHNLATLKIFKSKGIEKGQSKHILRMILGGTQPTPEEPFKRATCLPQRITVKSYTSALQVYPYEVSYFKTRGLPLSRLLSYLLRYNRCHNALSIVRILLHDKCSLPYKKRFPEFQKDHPHNKSKQDFRNTTYLHFLFSTESISCVSFICTSVNSTLLNNSYKTETLPDINAAT